MSFLIEKDESASGRRTVPFRLFKSDGTSPETGASNFTMLGSVNGGGQLSLGSISAVSANAGLYSFALSQSNVSVLGSIALYTDAVGPNFSQHVANVQIVNFNPFSSFSNIAAKAYSGVTFETNNIAAGTYSGVTIQGVSNTSSAANVATEVWAAASHSGVTIQGISNYGNLPNVNLANGLYSAVTVRVDPQAYSGLTVGINNIAAASYSGVSVEVLNIKPGSYSGVTIDGTKFLSTAGERSIASSHLSTNLGNSRLVQEALFAMRNRVAISGSTGTVYQTDDTTSAWTFSVTTVSAVGISDLNPAG